MKKEEEKSKKKVESKADVKSVDSSHKIIEDMGKVIEQLNAVMSQPMSSLSFKAGNAKYVATGNSLVSKLRKKDVEEFQIIDINSIVDVSLFGRSEWFCMQREKTFSMYRQKDVGELGYWHRHNSGKIFSLEIDRAWDSYRQRERARKKFLFKAVLIFIFLVSLSFGFIIIRAYLKS